MAGGGAGPLRHYTSRFPHLPAAAVVGCVAASAILFCGLAGLHGLPGVAAWPATLPDAKRPPTLRRARTACSAYSFSKIAASVPAHGIGDCARTVRSNLSRFEDRTNGLTMSVLHRVGYRPQIARCVFAWSERLSHHTCIEGALEVGVRSHGVRRDGRRPRPRTGCGLSAQLLAG